jgi:hypothetical protein
VIDENQDQRRPAEEIKARLGSCLSFSVTGNLVIPGSPEGRNPESRNSGLLKPLESYASLDSGFTGYARAPE